MTKLKNKHKSIICLFIVMVTVLITGCSIMKYKPPELAIEYNGNGGKATIADVVSDKSISCGAHPLQMSDNIFSIQKSDETALKLEFEEEPISVEIYCWDEKYIDTTENYSDVCMKYEMDSDGTVEISTDTGYIYKVVAEYERHSATVDYCFYIK